MCLGTCYRFLEFSLILPKYCTLQAAAHIHRYLNLDEAVLKEITGDSKEGNIIIIIIIR